MDTSKAGTLGVSFALLLAASGCGGTSTNKLQAAATAATSTQRAAPAAPTERLSILSPRPGAHTSDTLTVRVMLSGTATAGAQRFRYVLDRRLSRAGSDRLTFQNLAPGRHRLEVISA